MVSQHAKLAIFEKDSILPYGSGLFHYQHIFNRKAFGWWKVLISSPYTWLRQEGMQFASDLFLMLMIWFDAV